MSVVFFSAEESTVVFRSLPVKKKKNNSDESLCEEQNFEGCLQF